MINYRSPHQIRSILEATIVHLREPTSSVQDYNYADELQIILDNLMSFDTEMGVGDGAGQLFVFGTYEAIKEAQTKILMGEKLRSTLSKFLQETSAALRELQ